MLGAKVEGVGKQRLFLWHRRHRSLEAFWGRVTRDHLTHHSLESFCCFQSTEQKHSQVL